MKAGRYFVYPLKDNRYGVIDGDTIRVFLDRGWKCVKETSLRLAGIDTPEKKNTRLGGPLEKEAGLLVGQVAEQWLAARREAFQFYATSDSKPKYAGRTVGRLYAGWPNFAAGGGGDCLNDYLLTKGLATPYQGKKRPPWDHDVLREIIVRAQAILAET